MKTSVHLLSMPWAHPMVPSIQTACLKSYLDKRLKRRVRTRTYSPSFSIPYRLWGKKFESRWNDYDEYQEYIYFLIYVMRFGVPNGRAIKSDLDSMIRALNESDVESGKMSRQFLERLEKSTSRFIEEDLIPKLDPRSMNLIGFTMNYNQVYSSLFCAKYLMEHCRNRRLTFVFGGMSAALPEVVALMKSLGIPGYCSVGEGEKKLELLIARETSSFGAASATLSRFATGSMTGCGNGSWECAWGSIGLPVSAKAISIWSPPYSNRFERPRWRLSRAAR